MFFICCVIVGFLFWVIFFFFFKQKTAYEMRISDWSSDVCSSDLVVDAEGHVWTGLYNGWHLARFSPDGALVLTVRLPTQNLTKPCFGGPDMRTLFVTTAQKGLTPIGLPPSPGRAACSPSPRPSPGSRPPA